MAMESTRKSGMSLDRAGRYILQPTGYRAFIPKPLPPDPPVRLDALLALLSQADRVLGRLDGSTQILPNPDLFVYMYIRRESVLSSQIEGTQSSLHDVLAAEAKIFAILCERKALYKPVLYLSYYFKKHRRQYYESLQAVRDTGDWEQWLEFFLLGII